MPESICSEPVTLSRTLYSRTASPRILFSVANNHSHTKRVMLELYSLVKNYRDFRGRRLSTAFLQLPSKLVIFH